MNFKEQLERFRGWNIRFVIDGAQGLIIAGMTAMKLEGTLQEVGNDYISIIVKGKLEIFVPLARLAAFAPLEKGKR